MSKNVLMVVTSASASDSGRRTGLWIDEFVVPWLAFRNAGYDITVASPMGREIPVDPTSEEQAEPADGWDSARAELKNTSPLSGMIGRDFDAVFLPGGHGTMFDFPDNRELIAVLERAEAGGRVIAAVCHGPAGLVNAKRADGQPLVAGKKLTAFTDEEERGVGLQDDVPFLLETRLRERGADFRVAEAFSDHTEVDGRLITGQNPASSASTAQAVISAVG